jgi:hypothetical protein
VSQHPELHVRVLPFTTQLFEQVSVERSHAWYIGQSAVVVHPHLPCTHWLVPLQAPHAAPFVPQFEVEVLVMHTPDELQQPVGQFVCVHEEVHVPASHAVPAMQLMHEVPAIPHVESDDCSHCPFSEQQPEQVAGTQGRAASFDGPVSVPLS